ncbi:MAG: hypothetical protein U9N87_08000 [Planctomycetota bacterium]|nr:hypothetical protein [Planctomycetota bacterium]
MIRYRIARHPRGHYIVLPALSWTVPDEETYATRSVAQQAADGLNSLESRQPASSLLLGESAMCRLSYSIQASAS